MPEASRGDRWIRAVKDHVWVRRAVRSSKTEGGIVLTEADKKNSPLCYGLAVAVGPEVKGVMPGEVVFFDEGETREVYLDNKEKDWWSLMPEQSIYGKCLPEDAADLDFGDEGLDALYDRVIEGRVCQTA